ncbi:MAG: NAD(P)H-dependent oxidoreductase subunit E [Nocardioides sp.]
MTTKSQPARTTLVRAIADGLKDQRGALLPVLHEVMAECGYLDRADLPVIADVLNLSVADVHGVVSFYHDFRTSPPPMHTITLCRAEACQAVGAQELFDATRSRYRLDEDVDVREVFCLGNCALGPAGTIDGRLVGRLDGELIESLTADWPEDHSR